MKSLRIGMVCYIVITSVASTASVLSLIAQEKPVQSAAMPPMLSIEHRLQLQNVAQRIEIAQLKAQAAQTDFTKAREDLANLVQLLQKDGYDLDLPTLSYKPKVVEKK